MLVIPISGTSECCTVVLLTICSTATALHHAVQIMESLGGDSAWLDRFVAFHSAIVYFWMLIVFYAFSPKYAYLFSELVEWHATDTYAGASPNTLLLLTTVMLTVLLVNCPSCQIHVITHYRTCFVWAQLTRVLRVCRDSLLVWHAPWSARTFTRRTGVAGMQCLLTRTSSY